MDASDAQRVENARQALRKLDDQAVDWVTERFYETYPGIAARFGERGRQRCREDIRYHIEFLLASLASGSSCPFEEYIVWLTSVLKSRGISTEHIRESLWLLERFVAARLCAEEAAPIRTILQAGITALEAARPILPAFYRKLPPAAPESPAFAQAALAGDKRTAQNVVDAKLDAGADLIEVDVALIQPALYEVGQLWQINRISVAQEHLATAICQTVLAAALLRVEPAPPLDRQALFACVEGNFHNLGLRMVADAFELAGWESAYLGADVPSTALLDQVATSKPDVVGLSVSLPQHIEAARDFIQLCRVEFGAQCPTIMVGGLAMNSVDHLWQRVGADAWYPDARTAQREGM